MGYELNARPSRHSAEPLTVPARLLARIRGEYREMPGLRLTFAQATRFWQVDPVLCRAALTMLIREGVLALTRDNAFVAAESADYAPSRSRATASSRRVDA